MFRRTVEITVDEKFVSNYDGEYNTHAIGAAVGYLSLWAAHSPSKCKCKLHLNSRGEIDASYYDAENNLTYTIGGIWDEDAKKFTFHS